nr:unnamed protein product [Callosobruchus chinensis]
MLSNRYFRTYLGDNISRERKLNNGLPQGSVLAPLFNLYISDLPETRSKKFCYADDIDLACRTKDLGQGQRILTEHLAALSSYFKKWRLKSSESKTEKLCGTTWGASGETPRTSSLALVFSTTEYCAPVWLNSCHTDLIDVQLNHNMRLITGTIRPTPSYWLPLLSNIYPLAIRRTEALLRGHRKIQDNPELPVQEDIPALRRNRPRSRKPPL